MKFKLEWVETSKINCSSIIEADSETDAIELWNNGEFEYDDEDTTEFTIQPETLKTEPYNE